MDFVEEDIMTPSVRKALDVYKGAVEKHSLRMSKETKWRVKNGRINLGLVHPRTAEINQNFTQWNQTWVTPEELTKMASMVGVNK